MALLVQPGPLLTRGEVEVGLRPPSRPQVLLAVEGGAAHPVLRRELEAVADAHASLLGAVDQEEPAEAPERLSPEGLLALLVDEHDPLPGVGELRGGDETGQAGHPRRRRRFPSCPFLASNQVPRCSLRARQVTDGLPRAGGGTARTSGASSAAYGMKVLRLWRIRLGQSDTSLAAAVADAGFMTTETRAPVMLDEQLAMQLLAERIIVLGAEVDDPIANRITAQLLLLSARDPRADISLYINSPGGSVTAGLAIYDTMRVIPNDVSTLAVGFAASMGQFLLGAGTPGKRFALPNARIMMHQPSAGIQGTAADVEVQANNLKTMKRRRQRAPVAAHRPDGRADHRRQ